MRIVLFSNSEVCSGLLLRDDFFVCRIFRRRRRFGCLDNFRHFKTRDLFEEEQPPRRKEK